MSKTVTEQMTQPKTRPMADIDSTTEQPTRRRGKRLLVVGMLGLAAAATALTISRVRGRSANTRGRKSRKRH